MMCPACQNKTAPQGMECYLCGPSVQLPDRMLGVTGPLDAQGERDLNLYCRFVRNMRRERGLPHLRLQCQPHPLHGMVWRMVYVCGPSQRLRKASFWHDSAQGAVWSAIALWFPTRFRR